MKPIKLTIIGTITQDTITFPNGKRKRSYGGILYNILPLAYLAPENLRIAPVCNLGADIYGKVLPYLKKLKNIDTSGISRVKENNNQVYLYYDQKWNHKEILKNLVPEIKFRQVKPFLKCDYILINFISGFDMNLDCLKRIRRETGAKIFMDVHSLILGLKKDGKRVNRAPDLWEEYIAQADILQMNLKEMQILAGRSLGTLKDLTRFSGKFLSLGPEILLITQGRKGALTYCKNKNRLKCYQTYSSKIRDFTDPTGCGDFFTAGFLLAYLKTQVVERSSEFANFLAGMKSRFSGIEDFLNIFLKKRFI
jgi:sugar/nucleoside kinase (ribokinase family)